LRAGCAIQLGAGSKTMMLSRTPCGFSPPARREFKAMRQGLIAGGAALMAALGVGVLLTVLQWGIDPGRQTADAVTTVAPMGDEQSVLADPGLREAPRVLR
jgi:hypothetical protein